MKMQQLKDATYRAWENLSRFNGAVVQPETFKPEMRRWGDLRYKATWRRAYANYAARNIHDSCLDAYELITIQFNTKPGQFEYELRHEIFEAFIELPDGLDMLRDGLEQLFGQDLTQSERDEAYGIFELVQGQARRLGRDTVRSVQSLIGQAR